MTYEITCPKGHRLQVTEAHFGERVSCPTCNESFVVPNASGHNSSPSPPHPNTKTALDQPRASKVFRGWASGDGLSRASAFSRLAGRPLVAVGLMLVLLARGCDAIGKRGVDRAEAKASAARERFDDDWQTTRLDLERKISAIEESKEPKPEDQKKLADLKTQLGDLPTQQTKARKVQENGAWRTLQIDARTAKANQQINGYWREMFFVFASIILAVGLLIVSWTAEGAERWVSLVMLAIITVSIYIGGTAWMVGRL